MPGTRTRTCTWPMSVSRDQRRFVQHVQELVALEVQSETRDAHRERELTESNQTLTNTWLSWIELPIRDGQPVTLIGHLHYVNDRVEAIEFVPGDPRPQEIHADTHVVTGSAPRRRQPPAGRGGRPTPTGGSGGAPRPSRLGQFLSDLDTQLQNVGCVMGVFELFGAAAAEVVAGAAACLGSPVAILAGLHMVGSAQLFRDQIAFYRGYVLAIADLSQGRNPNSRRVECSWFNRGRAAAISYINSHGRDSILMLVRLHQDHPTGQAVTQFLWNDIVQSRISSESERALARSLRPSF